MIPHGFWGDFTNSVSLLNVGNYKKGEYEGPWKRYYRNGQLMNQFNDKKSKVIYIGYDKGFLS